MRLRIAEGVASQDELRRGDGHRRDSHFFKRGGKEPGAEAFAKGGEAVEELSAGRDGAMSWNFVKKVASQELQLAAHAKVILFAEAQIVKNIKVERQDEFGFVARASQFAMGESASDGKKMVGDTLHRGDDQSDVGCPRGATNETRGMEHALRTEKRAAAELEGDDIPALLIYAAGVNS
jgi:hypothetical protein